jgi:hypothetical protein
MKHVRADGLEKLERARFLRQSPGLCTSDMIAELQMALSQQGQTQHYRVSRRVYAPSASPAKSRDGITRVATEEPCSAQRGKRKGHKPAICAFDSMPLHQPLDRFLGPLVAGRPQPE